MGVCFLAINVKYFSLRYIIWSFLASTFIKWCHVSLNHVNLHYGQIQFATLNPKILCFFNLNCELSFCRALQCLAIRCTGQIDGESSSSSKSIESPHAASEIRSHTSHPPERLIRPAGGWAAIVHAATNARTRRGDWIHRVENLVRCAASAWANICTRPRRVVFCGRPKAAHEQPPPPNAEPTSCLQSIAALGSSSKSKSSLGCCWGVRARVRPCDDALNAASQPAETDSPGHVRTESRSLARSLQQAPPARGPPPAALRSQPQVGRIFFLCSFFPPRRLE